MPYASIIDPANTAITIPQQFLVIRNGFRMRAFEKRIICCAKQSESESKRNRNEEGERENIKKKIIELTNGQLHMYRPYILFTATIQWLNFNETKLVNVTNDTKKLEREYK